MLLLQLSIGYSKPYGQPRFKKLGKHTLPLDRKSYKVILQSSMIIERGGLMVIFANDIPQLAYISSTEVTTSCFSRRSSVLPQPIQFKLP